MAVPEEIKKLKPTNLGKVEIRHISNGYYVYSYSSYYSKEKKRSVKRTGKMLGKITLEDGFIPSKKYAISPRSYSVKVYGIYNLFEQTNKELIERLHKYYPHLYKEIFTIASLRLVHNCTNVSMKEFYDNSSLSITQPKLALSKNSMTRIYEKLGSSRGNMVDFMREYVNDDTTILFDGTNIFTQSSKASYAQKGYNHGKRKSTQVNLLYMFALKSHKPIFYRLLPGNIVDKKAFVNTIKESGVKNKIAIADKGFYSKANIHFLDSIGLSYIFPLKSDTRYISDEFVKILDFKKKFDGCFTYHKRPIWHKKKPIGNKGHYLYIFFDMDLKVNKQSLYMQKMEDNWKGYNLQSYQQQTKSDYIAFISNLDETPKDIYFKYKSRWEIEECFDCLKNSLNINTPYQDSNNKIEAWAFINHISLLLFYNLYNTIEKAGLSKKYSPSNIIDLGRNIHKVVLDDGQSFVSEITKTTEEVFKLLGVKFE